MTELEIMRAGLALHYSQRFGIYAVPRGRNSGRWWVPRLSSGHDPDLGWLTENQPHRLGWPNLAEAIIALGQHLENS